MAEQSGEVIAVVFGLTDVGRVRANNEDAFVVADLTTGRGLTTGGAVTYSVGEKGVLLGVSDGMGGTLSGEVASALVVESLRAHLVEEPTGTVPRAIERAVEAANRDVWQAAQDPERCGMGATLVAMLIHRDVAYVASVGDSRIYLLRSDRIRQVTKDQSYVEMLVSAGMMTRQEAEASPYRNVILQAMGPRPEITAAIGRVGLRRGDLFLLCSDGLSSKVAAEEMSSVLDRALTLEEACRELIDLANERGGEDNITVVLAEVSGSALADPPEGESITDTLETITEFDPTVAARQSAVPTAPLGPAPATPDRPALSEGLASSTPRTPAPLRPPATGARARPGDGAGKQGPEDAPPARTGTWTFGVGVLVLVGAIVAITVLALEYKPIVKYFKKLFD